MDSAPISCNIDKTISCFYNLNRPSRSTETQLIGNDSQNAVSLFHDPEECGKPYFVFVGEWLWVHLPERLDGQELSDFSQWMSVRSLSKFWCLWGQIQRIHLQLSGWVRFPWFFKKKMKCTCPSCGHDYLRCSGFSTEVLCLYKFSLKLLRVLFGH